jgi:hypothetical protein
MASTISAGTTAGTAIAIAGDTSGALALQTNNGTTAVTVDTTQKVGIGTTTPYNKLTIQGDSTTFQGAPAIALYDTYSNAGSRNWAMGIDIGGAGAGELGFICSTTQGGNPTGNTNAIINATGQWKTVAANGTSLLPASFFRAWVVFNGTNPASIISSFNVSSVTRTSTGAYTINFTTAMPDANYAVLGWNVAYGAGWYDAPPNASYVNVKVSNFSGTQIDTNSISVGIMR